MAKKAKDLVPTPSETEVEAYHFIRDNLKKLGWIVKNPSRNDDGQVWTQNQCLAHSQLKAAFGAMRPENVVKLTETKVWVIEAKRTRAEIGKAVREAELDYAEKVNSQKGILAPLISGVAGNDSSGYEVRTKLLVKGRYETVTINGVEATGLLDPKTVNLLLSTNNPEIADYQVNEALFLKAAEQINATLHNGGINKNDRSRVMAALLLALVGSSSLDLDGDLTVLIGDINNRTENVLKKHGKKEFHPFVRIEPPTNAENHVKYKNAIIQTIQLLNNLNIQSAMNSGADVLGKFYEVFLRYGNGAKEIGIVLTPRHITRFAVDSIGVSANDIVFDPACGTGGFLVAAFDHVRARTTPPVLEKFKRHNLFGVEQESSVAALAIVNMIFRGDGKNNIVEANCFSRYLRCAVKNGNPTAEYISSAAQSGEEPITRVFMNPPFALKKSDEREWRFVEAALKSMADGGILFAIVPMSVVSEGGAAGAWRRPFLKRNTLVSVVSFPEELFYPVAVQSVGIIVRKGIPHSPRQKVLWARVVDDGYRKSKGKRLPVEGENDLDRLEPILRAFLADSSKRVRSVPELVVAAPLDYSDPILEFAPEAYLESRIPKETELSARLDRQVRENISALVALDLQMSHPGGIIDTSRADTGAEVVEFPKPYPKFDEIALKSLFKLIPGLYHSLAERDRGEIPVVSCADSNNGVAGLFDIPIARTFEDALTIAFNGSPLTTKLHPYAFGAKDDVAVAAPRFELPPEALIFVQAQLNSERWRFSYYRKCFREKLERTTIELPITGEGEIDVNFMVGAVRAQPYWWFLASRLSNWDPKTMILDDEGEGVVDSVDENEQNVAEVAIQDQQMLFDE
ncbi:class I SAM-dependent DNA methyltransferase [Burkholderia ubonensis]|uniref:HsdM family class I SAM-dependent methyltransferase n=1 Tax=Burkholderia ubonensis TaxID=101571 RepID=UPI0009B3C660|nr:N-6 DNA methylase [Burkholderia ubonensis]